MRDYERCIAEIENFNVEVLLVTVELIRASAQIRRDHGLLTNDSISAAMMLHHGIAGLATYDSDLHRVPELTIFQPSDVR